MVRHAAGQIASCVAVECLRSVAGTLADEDDKERHSPSQALITAALNAGGRDNVTAIVLERLS